MSMIEFDVKKSVVFFRNEPFHNNTQTKLGADNKGHQLLKKMGTSFSFTKKLFNDNRFFIISMLGFNCLG